jgi:hypothetical protein
MAFRIHYVFLFLMSCTALVNGQGSRMESSASSREPVSVLIRCDDWGMCHSVNMAAQRVLDSRFPVSASVMFACPWYQEAVEILRHSSHVSVGIHLTLNAEWKNYR